jgi:acylphosphatase
VVRGRVQGVGFRAFTVWEARRLGLAGEVWNRADGCVELVCVHADPAVIDAFLSRLAEGPGNVEAIERHDDSIAQLPPTFRVVTGADRD